ncbi:MAG: glycosyltransferase family 2 protein, partial [Chloroflexota bacterium]|nr:glycosyltransferase family 2 protein [Chloroflexota bacterium]
MSTILISVVMPARNASQTIAIAIESILQQTHRELELIIVDDNSTDETTDIALGYAARDQRVRVYSLPQDDPERFSLNGTNINAGWAARNHGMGLAEGEWITFQDADDASLLNRMSVQHEFAVKYESSHVCIDWQKYVPEHLGKYLDVDAILASCAEEHLVTNSVEILDLARRCKGIIPSYFGWIHNYVPHSVRTLRFINRLFFGDISTPYPGAGNSTMIKAEIARKISFRPLTHRVWPSR